MNWIPKLHIIGSFLVFSSIWWYSWYPVSLWKHRSTHQDVPFMSTIKQCVEGCNFFGKVQRTSPKMVTWMNYLGRPILDFTNSSKRGISKISWFLFLHALLEGKEIFDWTLGMIVPTQIFFSRDQARRGVIPNWESHRFRTLEKRSVRIHRWVRIQSIKTVASRKSSAF